MSLEAVAREVSDLGFDELRAHVDGLAEDALWKIVREMQQIAAEDVESARSLLLEHPTLAMAVLRAQIRLGLNISQSIRDAGPALRAKILAMSAPVPAPAPPPPTIGAVTSGFQQQRLPHMSAPPPLVPAMMPIPTVPAYMGGASLDPTNQPNMRIEAAEPTIDPQHQALLGQLRLLTPAQLHALPEAQRQQIQTLLAQHQPQPPH